MRKKILIYSTLGLLVFAGYQYLFTPRVCHFRCLQPSLTLDTVRIGKFIESFPFSAQLKHDSTYSTLLAEIDQIYLSRVEVGMKASAWIKEKEHFFIVSEKDTTLNNGRFKIALSSTDSVLRGMSRTATVRLRLVVSDIENAKQIEVGGFYKDSGGKYIYVVLPDEKVVRRSVVLGKKNPEYIQVISGLEAGEVVITSSYEEFPEEGVMELGMLRESVENAN